MIHDSFAKNQFLGQQLPFGSDLSPFTPDVFTSFSRYTQQRTKLAYCDVGHFSVLLNVLAGVQGSNLSKLGQKREQTLFHRKLFKRSCLVHAKGKPFGADVQRASYSFMRINISMTLKL
jgi:hypothetical protein